MELVIFLLVQLFFSKFWLIFIRDIQFLIQNPGWFLYKSLCFLAYRVYYSIFWFLWSLFDAVFKEVYQVSSRHDFITHYEFFLLLVLIIDSLLFGFLHIVFSSLAEEICFLLFGNWIVYNPTILINFWLLYLDELDFSINNFNVLFYVFMHTLISQEDVQLSFLRIQYQFLSVSISGPLSRNFISKLLIPSSQAFEIPFYISFEVLIFKANPLLLCCSILIYFRGSVLLIYFIIY